jgi:hypothetical protein
VRLKMPSPKSSSLKRLAGAFALVLGAAAPSLATNLNLTIQSGGLTTVTVLPGATVNYNVVGVLNDAASDGLAGFSLDLTFTGGPLVKAAEPTSAPMTSFDKPAGLTNPAGFGGTVSAGKLVQVGGAQNTIANTFAPYPNGNVVTDVAQIGQALTLVTGQLTAPVVPGSYTLFASAVVANVIRQGQTGVPFWAVDKALPGTLTPLTVIVSSAGLRK